MPESKDSAWPAIPYEPWADTLATLHLWTQVVGKIRLACSPWLNHSWHATFYVTPVGLSTGTVSRGYRTFDAEFDFHAHELVFRTSDGGRRSVSLEPRTTADFYSEVVDALKYLDLAVAIHPRPNEIPDAVPFSEDTVHAQYDPEAVRRFWTGLSSIDRVFRAFRARFLGKASPSHFFWGSFDLAVTRFSGRPAPPHPGGYPNIPLWVMQEAYSHEVSSAGFWPGGEAFPEPIFYSYAYPTPKGLAETKVLPGAAAWNDELGEFVLRYEEVRRSASPEEALMAFLQSTYEAAADAAAWDRAALEMGDLPR
ncbi:MAG: DUF5996 family protein [Gammaproteobacteria bacterium]